jgi:hypothetical protein
MTQLFLFYTCGKEIVFSSFFAFPFSFPVFSLKMFKDLKINLTRILNELTTLIHMNCTGTVYAKRMYRTPRAISQVV